VLATHDPDRSRHLTPICFVFHDGCFSFVHDRAAYERALDLAPFPE
jgi:hypothetical protein